MEDVSQDSSQQAIANQKNQISLYVTVLVSFVTFLVGLLLGFLLFSNKTTNLSSKTEIPTHTQQTSLPTNSSTVNSIVSKPPTKLYINCNNITIDWKTCNTDSFSINIPIKWDSSTKLDEYTFTAADGYDSLTIFTTNTKPDSTIMGAPDNLQTKQINLSNDPATQYYGCFGIEGCTNEYIVRAKHNNIYYELDYLAYQPQNLYSEIVASFKFKN